MPIHKTYKRYASLGSFGVVGSTRSNLVMTTIVPCLSRKDKSTVYCITAALENVIVWDVRRGEKVLFLKGGDHEVTCIGKSERTPHIAVGYSDGTIKLWNLRNNSSDVSFSGHRSAISSLCFDKSGTKLVSGSTDTDIIVWDIVGESGLYRLKGHKGMITDCIFMDTQNVIISSSKDMLVKFWDLDMQHCFLTLVGHKSEVWKICLFNNETRLITGSGDAELRVYEVKEAKDKEEMLCCDLLGSILRSGKGRVISLAYDNNRKYLACHGVDSTFEIFHILTDEEIQKGLKKRLKKLIKKQKKKPESEQQSEEKINVEQEVTDEIKKIQAFKMSHKLRSAAISSDGKSEIKVLTMFTNNSFGYFKIDLETLPLKCQLQSLISNMGHRTDVRTVAFNSDATLLLSGSGESVKIWNRNTQKCIRTMESDYCLCSMFVPGERHVIVGTKTGKLQLFDISSGNLLESLDAHEDAVWSIALSPDKNGFVSGSADHDVKFWEFDLIIDEEYSSQGKRLSMSHVQTLKMTEEVLGIKYSPDGRLLAVSLLDSTVKVFFADTLKFFLSLYGHKFPVLCMDISMDSTLIVTGSADKNIKIWGLDFGDCHKSIFAHDDSITGIQFVAKTHYFFSVSKDKTLKYWDGDKFENIMTLKGHHLEIWSMAVSPSGEYVATSSHDKSIRLWQRTEELLVISEEREQEREELNEASLVERSQQSIPGENSEEVARAGKKTIETIKAAERIMEAIEICKEEFAKFSKDPKAEPHPILKAFDNVSPERYVLDVIRKVKPSELDESLLVLPFIYVQDLLRLINVWMSRKWEVELSSKCLTFLLKIHHNQITTNQVLMPVIQSLNENALQAVQEVKDQVGFNQAGLRFLQQQLEMKNVSFFEDAYDKFKRNAKTKKIVAF